ncbi:MAG: hypothetical protein JNL58_24130 [Planctomyces sp.]|nr:hypothetical protein [Planctomyces sp.]
MQSIPAALTWELFSRGRLALPAFFVLGNALPLFVYRALCATPLEPHDSSNLLMHIMFLPYTIFLSGLGVVVAQGSISRLYMAPVTTGALVLWHVFSGHLLLALLTTLSLTAQNYTAGADFPVFGPVCLAVAFWSAAQPLIQISRRTFLSVLAGMAPCAGVCWWGFARHGSWLAAPEHYWRHPLPSELIVLVIFCLISGFITVFLVDRDRRGMSIPVIIPGNAWQAIGDRIVAINPIGTNTLTSPARAMFWYEWRRKGIVLPGLTLLLSTGAGLILLIRLLNTDSGQHEFSRMDLRDAFMSSSLFVIPFLSIPVGLYVGTVSSTFSGGRRTPTLSETMDADRREIFSSFLATRPVANSDFAKVFLKVIAASIGCSTTILWISYGAMLLATSGIQTDRFKITQADIIVDQLGLWHIPLTIIIPWISISLFAAVTLSGRSTFLSLLLAGSFLGAVLLSGLSSWLFEPTTQEFLAQAFVFALVIGVLSFTLFAFRRSLQDALVSPRTAITCGAVWFLLSTAAWMLRPTVLPVSAIVLIAGFSALVVLPFATTPLAVAWNRHR